MVRVETLDSEVVHVAVARDFGDVGDVDVVVSGVLRAWPTRS
jgi:hypothetical protein